MLHAIRSIRASLRSVRLRAISILGGIPQVDPAVRITHTHSAGAASPQPEDLRSIIRTIRTGVAQLTSVGEKGAVLGHGTGFLVRGGLVTNDHVVDEPGCQTLKISFPDQEKNQTFDLTRAELETAKLVRLPHPKTRIQGERADLVFLKLENEVFIGRYQFELSSRMSLEPGSRVLYLGYPFGYKNLTAHLGHVSSIYHDDSYRTAVIQIDGSVNGGNSGGPLLDLKTGLVEGVVASAETGLELDKLEVVIQELQRSIEQLAQPIGMSAKIYGVDFKEVLIFVQANFVRTFKMLRRSANTGIGFAIPASLIYDRHRRMADD